MNFDSLVDDSQNKPSATAPGGAMSFDQLKDDSETYGSTLGELKAAGLGLARSASFGLSDEFLVKSGIMKPEELKAYKEQNPSATTAGEVGGVLGALLLPEVGVLGAASAPVKGVARLGAAATEAALPAASRVAGAIAPAATNPIINKVLSQSGALAVGSAVEGAAYGLGQNVTEHALGNPDLNAEKVVASIGEAALIGAGIGTIFGAAKGAVQAKFPKFLSEADKAAVEAGDFNTMVKASEISEQAKESYFKGITKLRPDHKEIVAAGESFGAKTMPIQISDSPQVKSAASLIMNGAPSYAGVAATKQAMEGFEKAALAVDSTLGLGDDITKATLGDTLKTIVSDTVEKQVAPLNALYDTLKSEYQTLTLNEKSLKQVANNIRRIEDVPLSRQAKAIADYAAERVESLKTVDDIKRLRTLIREELPGNASRVEKRVSSVISDKLADLEESQIIQFAKREMRTTKAKERVLQLLDQRAEANAQYAVFRGKLDQFANALGRKRVHGAQDFLDFLDDPATTVEKIAEKLTNKKNSAFLEFFSKEVPEGMNAISQYEKNLIRQSALKDGKVDVRAALKKIDKLPKEYREKIFTKQELDTVSNVKKWIDAFPSNYNPPNTDNARVVRSFFEGPTGFLVGNARDAAMKGFVDVATSGGDKTRSFVEGLSKIERGAQKTAKAINSGVSAIFTKELGTPAKGFFLTIQDRRDDHDKTKPLVSDLNANPEKLIEKLHENTEALSEFAPKTAAGVQNTMVRATQFLNSKLPGQNAPRKPLSPQYKPSDAEIAKWHKYFSAVSKPTEILKNVALGNLVPEQIEAVSAVYPLLMEQMRGAVLDRMTDFVAKEKTIPYRTKLSLSLFLGTDLVNSLDSVSMLANQNMMATATQAKAQQDMMAANRKPGDKLNKSSDLMTPMQKSAHRGEA